MGLFFNTPEVGTFKSPHSRETVMELLGLALVDYLPNHAVVVSEPPVMDGLYISELTDTRLVATVGNSVTLHYSLIVDLDQDGAGTSGHVYFDRKKDRTNHPWAFTQVKIRILRGMQDNLRSSSATISGKWDVT
ncbi:MAG: hypothetical protein U1E26_08140 [Coriobacteriia bacterium]|nr:hypothetical protein [Coriobacteriia bacterium]